MEKIARNYSIQLLLTVYQSPASAFMILKSLPLPQRNSLGTIETLCRAWGGESHAETGLASPWDAAWDLEGLTAPPRRPTKCLSVPRSTLNSPPAAGCEAQTLTHSHILSYRHSYTLTQLHTHHLGTHSHTVTPSQPHTHRPVPPCQGH